jgi:formate hydrogenlyase subunit 3/multisubunit Na+/H+ antiporter MnhD subunit
MDVFFLFVVVIFAAFAVFNTFKTRTYRAQGKFNEMKFYNAKTNISMGIMLIAMAVIQLFLHAETTVWRIGVGVVFMGLGLFNLVIGIRNYNTYLNKLEDPDEQKPGRNQPDGQKKSAGGQTSKQTKQP